jgi:Ca2+-binding RTX toxin-like protein
MELGTYTWNRTTGAFTSNTTVNTNGQWGLSNESFSNIRVDSDSFFADGAIFERVVSNTDPLVGGWTLSDANSTVAITFLEDGSYFLAESGSEIADPTGQDGMEFGTYTWNPTTGAFTSNTTVNTNGEWGLSHDSPVQAALSHLAANPYSITLAANLENLDLSGTGALRINATGNALHNAMTGNSGANTLSGSGGNDTLDGGGGKDSLDGGNGNDSLVWNRADTFDGGGGTDRLDVVSGPLNLAAEPNTKIRNVEQIDLTGGADQRLTLAQADVLAISTSTDTLTVFGDAGDSIKATGFRQVTDLNGFDRYKSGTAILLVESDVTVVF